LEERTETLLTTPVHGTIAVSEMRFECEEGMVYQRRCVGQVRHLKMMMGRHDTRNERAIPSVFGLPANDVTDQTWIQNSAFEVISGGTSDESA